MSSTSKLRPKLAWRHEPQACGSRHRQEVGVAGDEDVRRRCARIGQDPTIGGIPHDDAIHGVGLGDDLVGAQKRFHLIDPLGWKSELGCQHPPEFRQDDFANNEVVFGNDTAQQIGTDSASGNSTHQDVRVEEDPHETSRNTSSSVR